MQLWAGAWRLDGETDTFNLVGINIIFVEPPGYEEDQIRCIDYQVDPHEWIEAKEGDYIGFYLPDNGVFVASASQQSDPNRRQNQRNTFGYAENFNRSEVEVAASTSGRAILRAEIGKLVHNFMGSLQVGCRFVVVVSVWALDSYNAHALTQ